MNSKCNTALELYSFARQVAPACVKLMQNYFDSSSHCNNVLFVEGDLDYRIYAELDSISGNRPKEFSTIFSYAEYKKSIKESINRGASDEDGIWSGEGFQYVINAVETNLAQELNEKSKVTTIGIIDNDHGQHDEDVKNNQNLFNTETNDHETMLIFCFFDALYRDINGNGKLKNNFENQENFLNNIIKIFSFTLRQGILAQSSIIIEKERGLGKEDKKLLVQISQRYWRDGCADIDYKNKKIYNKIIEPFYKYNFEEELEEAIKSSFPKPRQTDIVCKLKDRYNKKLKNFFANHQDVDSTIKKWLINGIDALLLEEKKTIKEICWYSHGHIFFSQFKLCYDEMFEDLKNKGTYSKDYAEKLLIPYYKKEQNEYLKYNPIKGYKETYK